MLELIFKDSVLSTLSSISTCRRKCWVFLETWRCLLKVTEQDKIFFVMHTNVTFAPSWSYLILTQILYAFSPWIKKTDTLVRRTLLFLWLCTSRLKIPPRLSHKPTGYSQCLAHKVPVPLQLQLQQQQRYTQSQWRIYNTTPYPLLPLLKTHSHALCHCCSPFLDFPPYLSN